jgi:MoaA/NifB/PqqE/SkfB family radical SAM enzyme
MNPNSNSFCILSHVGVYNDAIDGNMVPCCFIDPKKSNFTGNKNINNLNEYIASDYRQYITNSLDNDIKIPECATCWSKEKTKLSSFRQEKNSNLLGDEKFTSQWINLFSKKHKVLPLLFADLKFSNVCNYTCAMCHPHNSTKIYSQWVIKHDALHIKEFLANNPNYMERVKNYTRNNRHSLLEDILKHDIKILSITGGEPLLDEKILQILSELETSKKQKISLTFVTNGSVDLVSTVNKLGKFKYIKFVISIESVGKLNDYIRIGSDWNFLSNNILNAQKNNISVSVNTIIQSLSLHKLHETIKWCKENNLEQQFMYLETPHELSCNLLPKSSIDNIINELPHEVAHYILDNYTDCSNKIEKLKYFINWHEKITKIKLNEVNNSLKNILENQVGNKDAN